MGANVVSKVVFLGSIAPLELRNTASRPLGYVVSEETLAGSAVELVSVFSQPLGHVAAAS